MALDVRALELPAGQSVHDHMARVVYSAPNAQFIASWTRLSRLPTSFAGPLCSRALGPALACERTLLVPEGTPVLDMTAYGTGGSETLLEDIVEFLPPDSHIVVDDSSRVTRRGEGALIHVVHRCTARRIALHLRRVCGRPLMAEVGGQLFLLELPCLNAEAINKARPGTIVVVQGALPPDEFVLERALNEARDAALYLDEEAELGNKQLAFRRLDAAPDLTVDAGAGAGADGGNLNSSSGGGSGKRAAAAAAPAAPSPAKKPASGGGGGGGCASDPMQVDGGARAAGGGGGGGGGGGFSGGGGKGGGDKGGGGKGGGGNKKPALSSSTSSQRTIASFKTAATGSSGSSGAAAAAAGIGSSGSGSAAAAAALGNGGGAHAGSGGQLLLPSTAHAAASAPRRPLGADWAAAAPDPLCNVRLQRALLRASVGDCPLWLAARASLPVPPAKLERQLGHLRKVVGPGWAVRQVVFNGLSVQHEPVFDRLFGRESGVAALMRSPDRWMRMDGLEAPSALARNKAVSMTVNKTVAQVGIELLVPAPTAAAAAAASSAAAAGPALPPSPPPISAVAALHGAEVEKRCLADPNLGVPFVVAVTSYALSVFRHAIATGELGHISVDLGNCHPRVREALGLHAREVSGARGHSANRPAFERQKADVPPTQLRALLHGRAVGKATAELLALGAPEVQALPEYAAAAQSLASPAYAVAGVADLTLGLARLNLAKLAGVDPKWCTGPPHAELDARLQEKEASAAPMRAVFARLRDEKAAAAAAAAAAGAPPTIPSPVAAAGAPAPPLAPEQQQHHHHHHQHNPPPLSSLTAAAQGSGAAAGSMPPPVAPTQRHSGPRVARTKEEWRRLVAAVALFREERMIRFKPGDFGAWLVDNYERVMGYGDAPPGKRTAGAYSNMPGELARGALKGDDAEMAELRLRMDRLMRMGPPHSKPKGGGAAAGGGSGAAGGGDGGAAGGGGAVSAGAP